MAKIEIKGQYTTAVAYANVIENEAIEQIRRMCNSPLTHGCTVRIMPDVHAGTGCTIGTTMTLNGRVCPNIVGVDIGCGMYTVKLAEKNINLASVDAAAHFIPSGINVWEGETESFEFEKLICFLELSDYYRLERSLGTLGGGNHFIEIDRAADGTLYLVIHSGSRNLGKQVAELYQKKAIENRENKSELITQNEIIIKEYKEQGREREISAALKNLKDEHEKRVRQIPKDLCWLEGKDEFCYLNDMIVCQKFAKRNRELIAETICKIARLTPVEAFHTVHNYIDVEGGILRKGAISAQAGERVLIPINMRDGSILGVGKGNKEWNYSAPHGAGRIMSRAAAKKKIDLDEFRASMTGIYTTSISKDTIDEAPMAYKSLEDIVGVIGDTVDVVDIIKPIYNFKAPDSAPAWRKEK